MHLELILSHKCNQSCYYCYYRNSQNIEYEINLDYIKYILDSFIFTKLDVILIGGEPGLATNLVECCNLINSYRNTQGIQIISNGLVRKKYGIEFLVDKKYNEHLISDVSTTLNKFYDMPLLSKENSNHLNIVVMTNKTTKALLNNRALYLQLKESNTYFKIFNPKSDKDSVEQYFEDLQTFYTLDNNIEGLNAVAAFKALHFKQDSSVAKDAQLRCNTTHEAAALDIDRKLILKCSANIVNTESVPITRPNLISLYKRELFTISDICNNCYYYEV